MSSSEGEEPRIIEDTESEFSGFDKNDFIETRKFTFGVFNNAGFLTLARAHVLQQKNLLKTNK